MDFVEAYLKESATAIDALRADSAFAETLRKMADGIVASLCQGGKLLLCGNGGSAADAQHIAGEFVCRLMFDRNPLPAIALTVDSSVLTAIGNDYGFNDVFERQVRALGNKGDVLLGISTSGNSGNVVRALEVARERGVLTYGFGGAQLETKMQGLCDILFAAPSIKTAIIQQLHITAAHIVCALVESTMFPRA